MSTDRGYGGDSMGIGVRAAMADGGRERTGLTVRKWDEDQAAWAARRLGLGVLAEPGPRHFAQARVAPYEVAEYQGNLITRAGWGDLLTGFFGSQATLFSTTAGRIGIGTGTTTAVATDTALGSVAGLTGSGSNWILCAANPTLNSGATPCTAVFTATFGVNDAIGAWNEFAIDHGTANSTAGTPTVTPVGHMINHSASSGLAGTKAASQIWSATATLSFT